MDSSRPRVDLTRDRGAELIRRVTDALLHIQGVEPDAALRARIYCLINEIPDGGWGFVGQAITREYAEARRRELEQEHA